MFLFLRYLLKKYILKVENKEIDFLFERNNDPKKVFKKQEELEFVFQMVSLFYSKTKANFPSLNISLEDCVKIVANIQINSFNILSNDNSPIAVGFYPFHSFYNHK
jgi:hypothetical protein